MKRGAPRLAACLLGLLLLACSRPTGPESAPERSSGAPSTIPVPRSAEAPVPSAGPVLTPEDVEPEVEHRITEQNLESELDRLEREIKAE